MKPLFCTCSGTTACSRVFVLPHSDAYVCFFLFFVVVWNFSFVPIRCALGPLPVIFACQFVTLKNYNQTGTYKLAELADNTAAGNGALGTDVVFIKPGSIEKKHQFD